MEVESRVLACPCIAQRPQTAKAGSGGFGIFVQRRNGHEALHGEVTQIGQAFQQRRPFGAFGIEAGFGWFRAELDFEQDWELFCVPAGGFVEALGQMQRVHAVDAVEELSGAGGFIGLQVSDEMDLRAGGAEFVQPRALRLEFLDAILAEEGDACTEGLDHRFRGVQL